MNTQRSAALLVFYGALSAGCAGLLGLDDKKFEGEGGGGDGGTTTASTGGGGAGGGVTGGTGTGGGGTGGGGTGGTGTGGGGTGGTGGCAPLDPIGGLDDEFDFATCGSPDTALGQRGWRFVTQEEPQKYANVDQYPGVFVEQEKLMVAIPDTLYWSNGKQGFLMYKEVTGDFLIVTKAKTTVLMGEDIPLDQQVGAGILVRDPFDLGLVTGGRRWIAADRGANAGFLKIHGTRSNDLLQQSVSNPADTMVKDGGVAVCRIDNNFSIWFEEPAGWVNRTDLLATALLQGFSDQVQVGLFAYRGNDTQVNVDPGVQGTFEFVHHHPPNGECDPGVHGE